MKEKSLKAFLIKIYIQGDLSGKASEVKAVPLSVYLQSATLFASNGKVPLFASFEGKGSE